MLAGAMLLVSVELVAPRLAPYVGPADIREQMDFTVQAVARVYLENADGSIKIETHDAADEPGVRVLADVRVYRIGDDASTAEAADFARSLVSVEADTDIVRIDSDPDEWPPALGARVDYVISVPRATDIEILGTNGNIKVAEGCGGVTIQSGNADIEILKPAGSVIARSTNGRIVVVDARESTTLETVNGNIVAEMRDGMLSANSVNGAIKTFVLDAAVSACVLSSDNGGIDVVLDEAVEFTVEAAAPRGHVDSEFPVGVADGATRVRGTVGSGETRLNLTTSNGSISIAKG